MTATFCDRFDNNNYNNNSWYKNINLNNDNNNNDYNNNGLHTSPKSIDNKNRVLYNSNKDKFYRLYAK